MACNGEEISYATATFIISENKREFPIHFHDLNRKSPVLATLVWNQPSKFLVRAEWNAPSFENFLQWIYGKAITFSARNKFDNLPAILNCYILSKQIENVEFGNAVLAKASEMAAENTIQLKVSTINSAYMSTRSGSALRRFVVDEYIRGGHKYDWCHNRELHKDFVWDVMVEALDRLSQRKMPKREFYADKELNAEVILID